MSKFIPIKTKDGTISLYNTEVNDIYHSDVGSYTEAMGKFVYPSGISEFAENNDVITIMDICYGLGYNSIAAITEIFKINPNCKINLLILENDPDVLLFSTFLNIQSANKNICELLKIAIRNCLQIEKSDVTFDEKNLPDYHDLMSYQSRLNLNSENDVINSSNDIINLALKHNIYYQSISERNISNRYHLESTENLNIEIYLSDARESIKKISTTIDFIFHDPFTAAKLPTLWTVDFFKLAYKLLSEEGNLTTYSSNSAVRGAMMEAGFIIGRTEPVGKKSSGTIATKQGNSKRYTQLGEYEFNLVTKTKAGIPYRDINLNDDAQTIIQNRLLDQEKSGKISTGKFMKLHKRK